MDPLPGKGLVRAFNVGQQASPRDAARPWAMIEGVGDMLQTVGAKAVDLLNKQKELQIQREAADMELEFDQHQQEYEMEVLQNPNMTPEQAMSGWSKRMEGFNAKYQRDGMSPLERDVIATRAKALSEKGGLNILKSSMVASIQNTKQSAINLITKGEQTGNDELRQRGFSMLGSVVPEADIESERIKSDSRVATTLVEAAINTDPVGMRDKLADPNFVKNNPGVRVDDIPRLQDAARSAARQAVGDSVDTFGDDLATGKVKTADDIDRLYGTKVPPRIVEKMKDELAQRYDEAEKARMKSPEAQAQMLGEASRLMSGLADATGDDFDQRYATASFLLGKMADSPAKELLTEKLRVTKSGREAEIKTHADAAFKALEDYDKTERERAGIGGSGASVKIPGAQEMPTSRAIADGFLRDWNKLKALGFSDKQASAIRDAKDSKGELDDAQAKSIFRQEWKNRENGNFGADPLTMATADAILGGSEKISYVPPEALDSAFSLRIKADQEAGERKIKLAEWLKLNPDAKPDEINTKVREIAGEQTYRKVSSGIYESKDSSTSFNDLPETAPRGDFTTGAGNVVTPESQALVQENARPYLKNPEFDLSKAPLGMRNNNPTNIVYPNDATATRFGAIGASSNHDAGSTDGSGGHYRQMVFANPEDGMKAGARLALSKYRSGKVTTNSLIASENGWTPGNYEAANNIARTMGLGPDDDIKINTAAGMAKFLKALAIQEHGPAAKQYKDSLFTKAAQLAIR